MNIKDIKIGETYNVRMRVTAKGNGGFSTRTLSPSGKEMGIELFNNSEAVAFSPIPDESKCESCRKFKKDDKVQIVDWNGRAPIYLKEHIGTIQVVDCDEDSNGVVGIVGDIEAVYVANLKLVTPVEELEPYSVGESTDYFSVDDMDGNEISCYWKNTHPNPKAAAEAERDRLIAEHRKDNN